MNVLFGRLNERLKSNLIQMSNACPKRGFNETWVPFAGSMNGRSSVGVDKKATGLLLRVVYAQIGEVQEGYPQIMHAWYML